MPLKVLILCAGYGTRLQRDLENAKTDEYRHLVGVPKPLLPICNQPLISHWIDQLNRMKCGDVEEVVIVANDVNKRMFEDWKEMDGLGKTPITILSDGTRSNEGRLGAVASIQFAVEQCDVRKSDHDLIVIGGDTLFFEDVHISDTIDSFHKYKSRCPEANMVIGCPCTEANVPKHGILELNAEDKVIKFLEKPSLDETPSRIQCPCFYMFSNRSLQLLEQFLFEKKDEPLQARDAPGNFIRYLIERAPVFCQQVSGRFDVGDLESYLQCCNYFQKRTDLR